MATLRTASSPARLCLTSSLALAVVLVACGAPDGHTVVVLTPPTPLFTPAPPPPPPVRETGVIEEFDNTLRDTPITYTVTVPSDGTLVAELTWESDAQLRLTLGDMSFPASPPNASPVVGRIEVLAGQAYRVVVEEGRPSRWKVYDYWEYHGDQFVVRLSLE